jgi:phosphatidylserine decarboxylase
MPVVAVGAYNVGRIAASFERLRRGDGGTAHWRTNVRGAPGETRRYDPPIDVRAGDEIMAFHLGSTVVLLFEPGRARLLPALEAGREIRAGEAIARVVEPDEGSPT